MAGVVGGLTGALKAGLVEPSPEASKALWIESGSMLFLLFFFFSFFPFFGSFLISHGSIARVRVRVCSMHFGFKMFYFLKLPQKSHHPPRHHQTRLWMGWNHHPHLLSWQTWSCRRCHSLCQSLCPTPLTRSHPSSSQTNPHVCEASFSAAF